MRVASKQRRKSQLSVLPAFMHKPRKNKDTSRLAANFEMFRVVAFEGAVGGGKMAAAEIKAADHKTADVTRRRSH